MKDQAKQVFLELQKAFCAALEALEPAVRFKQDQWTRDDIAGDDGGGGLTRVMTGGKIFEKGGVNFSEVRGTLPATMVQKLLGVSEPKPFYAAGTSLVIHPYSPMVPTVHANVRYLEVENKKWFGGGSDLTPYYLFPEDAGHFHQRMKAACDSVKVGWYQKFKDECDRYFYLPHRGEARGIGGIFFDYIGKDQPDDLSLGFNLVSALAQQMVGAYLPIVERRYQLPWTEQQKHFQLIRRGRYVEFNLVYDRGTLFGLQTNGRTESILMSLPFEARWEYDFRPEPSSPEAELIQVLKTPRAWIS